MNTISMFEKNVLQMREQQSENDLCVGIHLTYSRIWEISIEVQNHVFQDVDSVFTNDCYQDRERWSAGWLQRGELHAIKDEALREEAKATICKACSNSAMSNVCQVGRWSAPIAGAWHHWRVITLLCRDSLFLWILERSSTFEVSWGRVHLKFFSLSQRIVGSSAHM